MNPTPGPSPTQKPEQDADLGVVFYKVLKGIKDAAVAIGHALVRVVNSILLILLFLVRRWFWLVLGLALGFAYGLYQMNKRGESYSSQMTLKTNFSSSRSLYNSIDYVNALISNGQLNELSMLFGISDREARQMENFSARPVESEVITTDMYRQQFFKGDRAGNFRQDTFWIRTMEYKEFKDALTKYDYPLHEITVVSTNPNIFAKLQKGLITYISNNNLLQEIRNSYALSNKDQERWIAKALVDLDSLRDAYNQRLKRGQSTGLGGGNQMTVLESSPLTKTPELDIYDKMLELIDELKAAREQSVTSHDVIEVYSPFNPTGQKVSFLRQSVARFSLLGLYVSAAIVLLIALYKYLLALEKARVKTIKPATLSKPDSA